MATEGDWELITDVPYTASDGTVYTVQNRTLDIDGESGKVTTEEPWGLQKGSSYLFILKQQLVSLGWEVVSSSFRTNYMLTGTRDIVNDYEYDPVPGSSGIDLVGTYGGVPYYKNKNFFQARSGDGWIPENGIGASPSGYNKEFTNGGNPVGNPPWSVIYPGYVSDNFDVANDDFRRYLRSNYYEIPGKRMMTGRSWCLLAAPTSSGGFFEAGSTGVNSGRYHILLDYMENDTSAMHNYTPGNKLYTTFNGDSFYENKLLGTKVAIYVFPSYGDEYSDMNDPSNILAGAYNPDQFIRPSHKYEVGNIVATNNSPYGIIASSLAAGAPPSTDGITRGYSSTNRFYFCTSNSNYLISNIIHDKDNGSVILLTSENGIFMSMNILGTIADGISRDITLENGNYFSGTKFFHFWSYLSRGFSQAGTINSFGTVNILNTIFDDYESCAHTYYYKKYTPLNSGIKYQEARIISCAPLFAVENPSSTPVLSGGSGTRRRPFTYSPATALKSAQCIWNVTNQFSKPTVDYTYVEWPLPMLSIVPGNSNYSYVGRFMDIKMGPIGAPNGLIAKENPTSAEFDRILINGLWLPYGGTAGMVY